MRALVLSSGGSRGQYHLGALQYLYKEKAVSHQIFSGTSIGAIFSTYLAQYPTGQESFAIDRLTDLFSNIHTDQIYKSWKPFGAITGLFRKKSFYDSTPLRNLINTHIDRFKILDARKKVRVGVTLLSANKDTAESTNYKVYTEYCANLKDAVAASSAFSPFLAPIVLDEGLAVDGGVQQVTPIKAALDAGATEIDVVICYPTQLLCLNASSLNALELGSHVIDLMLNRLTWIDVERTRFINELVRTGQSSKYTYVTLNVIHPKTDLGVQSLKFDTTNAKRLQKMGWADAKLLLG